MPKKRKGGNLNKECRECKRSRQRRELEGREERIRRLERDAQRHGQQRAEENECERIQRQEVDAQRHAQRRANEKADGWIERLRKDAEKHAEGRRKVGQLKLHSALIAKDSEINVQVHKLGPMNVQCKFCKSLNFEGEKNKDGNFTYCCQRGRVQLRTIDCPEFLKKLYMENDYASKKFRDHIRSYNSAIGMASMGAPGNRNPFNVEHNAPYCLKIHGQYHHLTSTAMHPAEGQAPRYAQMYFLDTEKAIKQRMTNKANKNCDPEIMSLLTKFMEKNNDLAQTFKMMRQVEQELNPKGQKTIDIMLSFRKDPVQDQRRYNAPRANEIAVVFKNIDGEPPYERDIRIYNKQSSDVQQISIMDKRCDPMCYPLLYPYGGEGWHTEMKTNNPKYSSMRITQMDYYAHLLAPRAEFSQFKMAGKLRCQFILDAYMKTEANRLNYIRRNQPQLRAELYSGLMDHIGNRAENEEVTVGIPIILPSSFMGSPRNMQERYQDAMSMVRKYGKPDIFLTMTCNPQSTDIKENLDGCQIEFRPDIVAKTFNLDVKELMKDLIQNKIFGNIIAYAGVIEFQKRGLPHLHLLAMLSDEDKPRLQEIIDMMVWAEIPEEEKYPELNAKVLKHMIHGPCGDPHVRYPCTGDDRKCSKGFPKEFREETNANVNGYPMYQRRDLGKKYIVRNKEIDNRWVVPYSPYLLMKYNRHINMEICSSVKSVKYIYKYIHKGFDCAAIEVKARDDTRYLRVDEVNSYLDARYVSAPEAIWRLNGYDLYIKSHTVIRLAVHLPDQQMVYFREGNEEHAAEREQSRNTTLTAWFKLNQRENNAVQLLYTEIPTHYVYDKKETQWKLRKKGAEKIISRLYTVSIKEKERFFLRVLLLHVAGAKSFEDLRTVNGVMYETFREAADMRKLIETDNLWTDTLEEATETKMPAQIRELFACICIFGSLTEGLSLWNKYKEHMIEDFEQDNEEDPENMALNEIQEILRINGSTCENYNLPQPTPVKICEMEYDADEEKRRGDYLITTLNQEQKHVYEKVIRAIEDDEEPERLFCIDGFAGSGKTYLFNTLLSVIRGRKEIVIPCASTGIAATLLKGGRTYHSLFKLSIPIDESVKSNIRGNTQAGRELTSVKLIIWDEVSMTMGHALTAVDKLFRDLMKKQKPFGGKVILFAGDFRQNLPVVPHAHKTAIIESTVKYNRLWRNVNQIKLTQNMRTAEDKEFANWLMLLGDGKLSNTEDLDHDIVEIPEDFICEDNLITEIFGEKLTINMIKENPDRAILCPKNEDTFKINDKILGLMEGEEREYISIDSIISEDPQEQLNYPTEFLNSLTPTGMPNHRLIIKVGVTIILLRNLNTKKGLCNGTRLIVNKLNNNLIYAEVLTGRARGQIVIIPRIDLVTSDKEQPFRFKRRQFPIRMSFAMTINKSQGQTLKKVGIFLPQPVFAHGQLYVAFSRATKKDDVKIKIKELNNQGHLIRKSKKCFTKNVIYREVL